MRLQSRGGRPDLVLGLDEAGRGSLLGPLVVGGFLAPRETLAGLAGIGVRDSKLLSPRRRSQVYHELVVAGQCCSLTLAPRTIDAYVRRHALNRLEAEAFARLIRETKPSEVYVDACDVNAERFGRLVESLAEYEAPVRATHEADRTVPVVGAASIVAKVRRDRAIRRIEGSIGAEIGSGYPSDERTIRYVSRLLERAEPPPPWLRRSWATMRRLMPGPTARPLETFTA